MDYYTVGEDCLLVEEFAWRDDRTAAGLRSACWTGRWWGAAAFSREVRADPVTRERVRAVRRGEAETVFRRLGGASLPAEAELRAGFEDYQAFAQTAPLRLNPSQPLRGYREKRVYRVLFAPGHGGELHGERTLGQDRFSWVLRAVGGVAYGLDVTVHLRHANDANIGTVIGELTEELRMRGLIPVTVERFA